MPYVSWYERTKWSLEAFEAEYGEVGIILGGLKEKLLAVGMVVGRRRCRGGKRRRKSVRMRQFKRSVYFIGRDMVEQLAFISLGTFLPGYFGSLQKRQSAHPHWYGRM